MHSEQDDNQLLEFVRRPNGGHMFVCDGYTYVREKKIFDKIFWKCSRYRHHLRCLARCCIQGSNVTRTSEHNHPPDLADLQSRDRYFYARVEDIVGTMLPGEYGKFASGWMD